MRVVPRSPNGLKMINQENHSSGGHPKCLPAYCRRQVDRVSRPDHVASRKNELNSSTLELGPSHCRESMRRLRVSLTIKGNRAIPITLPKKRLDISVVTPYFWLRFLLSRLRQDSWGKGPAKLCRILSSIRCQPHGAHLPWSKAKPDSRLPSEYISPAGC